MYLKNLLSVASKQVCKYILTNIDILIPCLQCVYHYFSNAQVTSNLIWTKPKLKKTSGLFWPSISLILFEDT